RLRRPQSPPCCVLSRPDRFTIGTPCVLAWRPSRLAGDGATVPYPTLVTLVILDGWGVAPPGPGNAVELADTPVFDELEARYPHTLLEASGEAAGLPPGQMGNSEVGHLTIGSGRRLYQDLMRVNRAIADGSLAESPVL